MNRNDNDSYLISQWNKIEMQRATARKRHRRCSVVIRHR